MDALPKPIADMVNGVAEATQTDPAMAATSALSALSACTGGHAVIEIRSGWREPLNLYTVTIAEPGERKCAVQEAMVRPIHDARGSLAAASADARSRPSRQAGRDAQSRPPGRQRNRAANATPGGRRTATRSKAQMAALYAESLEVPPVPRLVADDITPEKAAASLLAEQGGRLAIISAEGGIFDIIAGRYSKVNFPTWTCGSRATPGTR